jgi:RNA recognition motif-containing protein
MATDTPTDSSKENLVSDALSGEGGVSENLTGKDEKPTQYVKGNEGEVGGGTSEDVAADHSKRVYVGNLAWEVTSQDLSDHMKSGGLDVKSANVLISPDGRSKGCGIIEFASSELANQAVETMNDSTLKGRQIFVREDRGERRIAGGRTFDRSLGGGRGRGRNSSFSGRRYNHFTPTETSKDKRVYVGNLSWEVAWQDLKDHMVEAGDVVHAEVIKEPNGRSKGCGIVEFATEEGAKNAIATLTDTELKGRRKNTNNPPPKRGWPALKFRLLFGIMKFRSVWNWTLCPLLKLF